MTSQTPPPSKQFQYIIPQSAIDELVAAGYSADQFIASKSPGSVVGAKLSSLCYQIKQNLIKLMEGTDWTCGEIHFPPQIDSTKDNRISVDAYFDGRRCGSYTIIDIYKDFPADLPQKMADSFFASLKEVLKSPSDYVEDDEDEDEDND